MSVTTIRRLEALKGEYAVAEETAEGVLNALQEAGVEFIHDGVCLKRQDDAEALYEKLLEIAKESAKLQKEGPQFTEDDLYDENGLPA